MLLTGEQGFQASALVSNDGKERGLLVFLFFLTCFGIAAHAEERRIAEEGGILLLLLLLLLMFLLATKYQNILVVAAYLVAAVIGEAVRLCMLPKDIKAHLEDSGYRE